MNYKYTTHERTEYKRSYQFPLLDYVMAPIEAEHQNLTQNTIITTQNILRDQINGIITNDQACDLLQNLINTASPSRVISQVLYTIKNHIPKPQEQTEHSVNRKCRMWTPEEDIILLAGIHKFGLGDWKSISTYVGNGRSRSQCSQRWGRVLDPKIVKDIWTEDEDATLLAAVHELGEHSWASIAKRIKTRSDVQCRYRYFQIKKKPFKAMKEAASLRLHCMFDRKFFEENQAACSSVFVIRNLNEKEETKTYVQKLFERPLKDMIPPFIIKNPSEPCSPKINRVLV